MELIADTNSRTPRLRKLTGCLAVLLAAFVATLPQFIRGPSCGHDFDFHLVSWLDALQSWRHGILYPHWTASPNFGAGEPRFIFYPPLTWMLGAALGAVIPWTYVAQVLELLLFAATGLATRALARQAFSEGVATLAGCTAIFSGYTVFTAYERSAYAEMTGGFWIPLMLLLILRDRGSAAAAHSLLRRAFDGSAFPLTLVVAGAWLSNAPLGVMLTYLLAVVAVTAAVLAKSWAPVLRAASSTAIGLGLTAFFLVPAAWEQRWVAIRQAVDDPGLLIENSWLFAHHADPSLELHDIELTRVSVIGVSMVAVALAGVLASWWRKTLPARRASWIPLALIPVLVLFLLLPVSEPIWRALPKLRFLQFPWRWLVVLEAPMAIFFAAAIWTRRHLGRAVVILLCAALFLSVSGFALLSLFQRCDEEDAVQGMLANFVSGEGFEGTDEYAPPDADDALVATGLPFGCLVANPAIPLGKGDPNLNPDWSADQHSCEATFSNTAGTSAEHLRMTGAIPQAGYLVLRLRTYPAWRVRLNGRTVTVFPRREDGLMAVPVGRGPIELTADWTTTPDVRIGRLISIAALLLVTALGSLEYLCFRARL